MVKIGTCIGGFSAEGPKMKTNGNFSRIETIRARQLFFGEPVWISNRSEAILRCSALCYFFAVDAANRSCIRRVMCGTMPSIRSISINWPR